MFDITCRNRSDYFILMILFQKMVLINLTKLINLIDIVNKTPKEVSKRRTRLLEAYNELEADTDFTVSIKLSTEASIRLKEAYLDDEEHLRRVKILEELIANLTESKICIPESIMSKVYLLPSITNCTNPQCCGKLLVICRPTRTENSVSVFTNNGVLEGEVYRKNCLQCKTIYFYNYMEKEDDLGILIRSYYQAKESKESYFSITNETFYEKALLSRLTEEIVTCNVQFTNWSTCYNRLFRTDQSPMDYRGLIQVWLIFEMWMRFSIKFPVVRQKSRNIDIESTCEYLYPKLREKVDKQWITHNCQFCDTRLVVLDGDAKAYRTVCSFEPKKVITTGQLNQFIECANSPVIGKDKCCKHIVGGKGDYNSERIDFGKLTRSRRIELSIDIDYLTTDEGCRKRENITQRTVRSKTAGMIYCYR